MKNIKQLGALLQCCRLHFFLILCFFFFSFTAAMGQDTKPTTVPDNSYGKNGTKTTSVYKNEDGETITEEEYKNGSQPPKVMQRKRIRKNDLGETIVVDVYYTGDLDANGKEQKLKETYEKKDPYGTVIESQEYLYDGKTGKIIKGSKTETDSDGKKKKYTYDKDKNNGTGGWKEITSALPKNCNEAFVGIPTIFESGGFNTFGLNATYTHPFISQLGITGDAGIYFGSHNIVHFTKIQPLVGVSYFPNAGNGNISFSPHLLAGVSIVKAKYESFSGNSTTSFSLAAGTNVSFPLNEKFSLTARADYNPTFTSLGVQSNFRIGIGVSLKICPEQKKNFGETKGKEIPNERAPVFFNVSAHDFNQNPPLFRPDDEDLSKPLQNPMQTQSKDCEGSDEFEYYNAAKKDIDATLIIKNSGKCKVHVLVEKLTEKPGKNPKKQEKEEGDTKEKGKNEKNKPGKEAKEKGTPLFDYGVDEVQGSDIYSFRIPKKTRIRISIFCREGGGPCDFKRNFSVTTEKEINAKSDKEIPKLPVDPPAPLDKIEIYDKMGNRCISKDLVFYKITNRDLKDSMIVYFKAVSECPCYFEVYTDLSSAQAAGEPKPLEGGKLGLNRNDESPKIAKPAKNVKSTNGEEQFQYIPPGKTIYIKGRCPTQEPAPGPCKGHVEITGIAYTIKK